MMHTSLLLRATLVLSFFFITSTQLQLQAQKTEAKPKVTKPKAVKVEKKAETQKSPSLKMPEAPFDLEEPDPQPHDYNGQDLREFPAAQLRQVAQESAMNRSSKQALQLQYWAVQNDPTRGSDALATYYAHAKDIDTAIYYLQEAASGQGLDVRWAKEYPDLANLRADDRWEKLLPYLEACSKAWAEGDHRREVLTLPAGYTAGEPIPILIGLHGYGSKPEDFAGGKEDQELADKLGMALLGVSASKPRGRNSFVWSEDLKTDYDHIKEALERVKDKVTPKKGSVILAGFSQGAQLSTELAAKYPNEFDGVIALSPGMGRESNLAACIRKDSKAYKGMNVVIIIGSEESFGNIIMAQENAAILREAGVKVIEHTFEGMGHSFPPGFYDQIHIWLQFMLPAEAP